MYFLSLVFQSLLIFQYIMHDRSIKSFVDHHPLINYLRFAQKDLLRLKLK